MSKYDNSRIKYYNATFDSFVKCARYLTQYFEGEERDAELKKLKMLMQDFCNDENIYTSCIATFTELQNEIRKRKKKNKGPRNQDEDMEVDEDNGNPFNVREEFNRKLAKKLSHTTSPELNAKYIDFEKRIQAMTRQGDDELVITEHQVNTVDPISQQRMVNPVRIKQCGHTFEKNSITSLLKKRHHIRCPLPGCVEVKVTLADLEDDHELKKILATR